MKFAKLLVLFALLCCFPDRLVAQPAVAWKPEHDELKASIVRDIEGLRPINRVKYYARLGNVLWDIDQKSALVYLRQATQIALDPKTPVESDNERLDAVLTLDSTYGVRGRDEESWKQIFNHLQQSILNARVFDQRKAEIAISVANRLLRTDRNLAFECAMQSLKSSPPVVNWSSGRFFTDLQKVDEPLANLYFARLLEAISNAKDSKGLEYLLYNSASFAAAKGVGEYDFYTTESQEKDLRGVLIPFIERDAFRLSKRQVSTCGFISNAYRLRDYYRSTFPDKWPAIANAINTCQLAPIDPWKKPSFLEGKPVKTVDDILAIAKSISDPEFKASWVFNAGLKARDEKDYRRSINILDSIQVTDRIKLSWNWTRAQVARDYIDKLLNSGQAAEAQEVIEKTPLHLQPHLITHLMRYAFRIRGLGDWTEAMVMRVRSIFARMEFPQPSTKTPWPSNPSEFIGIVNYMSDLGRNDEAVEAFNEFIQMQNLLASRYASKEANGDIVAYYNTGVNKRFVDTNFNFVLKKVGEIEARPIRLEFRLNILRLATRSGSAGGGSVIKIN